MIGFVGKRYSLGGIVNGMMGQAKMQSATPNLLKTTNAGQLGQANTQEQAALGMQNSLAQQLAGQGGMQNQANVFGQQQGLADQLALQAQGGGPNPALAQFQQATGQNVANQAALMAGQRGASSNVGLMARQAAQQGAGIEQGAAGQMAAQQAQQQLNAQQQLGQQQAQMQNVAGQQVQNQMIGAQNYGQMAGQNQAAQMGAAGALNSAQTQQNQINAQTAQQNAHHKSGLLGNILGGVGAVLGGPIGGAIGKGVGSLFGGHSGESAQYVAPPASGQGSYDQQYMSMPTSKEFSHAKGGLIHDLQSGGNVPGQAQVHGDSYKNDTVPAMLSPGEIVIPRHVMQSHDPVGLAAEFVRHAMTKGPQHKDSYADAGMVGSSPEDVSQGIAERSAMPMDLTPQPTQEFNPEAYSMAVTQPQEQFNVTAPQNAMPEIQQPAQMSTTEIPMISTLPPTKKGSSSLDDYSNALSGMKSGLEAEAKATGDLGKTEAGILSRSEQALKNTASEYKPQYHDVDQERQQLTNDVQSAKVDPNRLYGNMGTPQKIMTAIGLIAGGMHTGEGENQVAKYLQNQVNADIDSQKADLGKKENLLSMNFKRYGNLKDAESMARAHIVDLASLQMKKAAAMAQDPMAKARLMSAQAKLEFEAAQATAPIKYKQEIMKGLEGGVVEPAQAITALVEAPLQSKALEEYGALQKHMASRNDLIESFNKVKMAADPMWRAQHPILASSGVYSNALNAQIAELNKEITGRFNEAENQQLKKQFEPGAIGDNDDKLKRLLRLKDSTAKFPVLQSNPQIFGAAVRGLESKAKFGTTGQPKLSLGEPVR